MPNQLHFYTKYGKEKIKIAAKPFASGGEGAIYSITSPRTHKHLVVKVYYPEKRTNEREKKMIYLVQHPPVEFSEEEHPSVAWVQDLVYKDDRFIGILLRRIKGKKLTKLTLNKLPRRADEAWKRFAFGQPEALKLRLHTCFNLAIAIQQIHEYQSYVLVDLKPDNVIMQANGLLAIVDMDSVEVIEQGKVIFSAPVATPEYTPPEYYQEGKQGYIEESWDRFSLGVIFYQLLFGLHPFAAASNPPYEHLVGLDDKIQHGLYVHDSNKQSSFKVIPPPHQQFYQTPSELQELFQACFQLGAANPLLRPTALEWCEELAFLLKIPFNRYPKIELPPSDLYFSPADYVATKNIDHQLPYWLDQSLEEVPSIVYTTTFSSKKIKERIDLLLQDKYREHLSNNRLNLSKSCLFLIGIGVLLYFQLFPILFLLVLTLFVLLQFALSSLKTTTPIAIGKKLFQKTTYELLGIKDLSLSMLKQIQSNQTTIDQQLSEKKTLLKQQVVQLNTMQKEMAKQVNVVQEYLNNRAALESKTKAFKDWLWVAKAKMTTTRKKEFATYQDLIGYFNEKLFANPRFQAYSYRSYEQLKTLIEDNVQQQEQQLQKKINPFLHTLTTKHEEAILEVNNDFDEQQIGIELSLKMEEDELKKQLDSLQNEANLKLDELKKTAQQNQTLIQLTKQIQKKTNGASIGLLEEYIHLIEEQQMSVLPNKVKKQFEQFTKQIQGLNIYTPEIKSVLALLAQDLSFINMNKFSINSFSVNKIVRKLNTINSTTLLTLDQLQANIQKAIGHSLLLTNSLQLTNWTIEMKKHIDLVRFKLNKYIQVEGQFFSNKTIFILTQDSEIKQQLQTIKQIKKDLILYQKEGKEEKEALYKMNINKTLAIDRQQLKEKHQLKFNAIKKEMVLLLSQKATQIASLEAAYQFELKQAKIEFDQEKSKLKKVLVQTKEDLTFFHFEPTI